MEGNFGDYLRLCAVVGLLLAAIARLIWAKVRKPGDPEIVGHVRVPYGKTIIAVIIAFVVTYLLWVISRDPLAPR